MFLQIENYSLFHMCVCLGAFSSSSSSLKKSSSLFFSLCQAHIWLLAKGKEVFVSTKWDNGIDKTIVSNNILIPPLSL